MQTQNGGIVRLVWTTWRAFLETLLRTFGYCLFVYAVYISCRYHRRTYYQLQRQTRQETRKRAKTIRPFLRGGRLVGKGVSVLTPLVGCEELTDMDEETETKAIEKWLRMVDKPLETKKGDKRGRQKRRGAKR